MNIILLSILLMVALVLIIPNAYAHTTPTTTDVRLVTTGPLNAGENIVFNFVVNSQHTFDSNISFGDGLLSISAHPVTSGSASISRNHVYVAPGEYTITHTVSCRDTTVLSCGDTHPTPFIDTLDITVLAVNTPPTTSDRTFDVNQGATTSLNIDELYSDETPNRELTLSIVTPPMYGTAELLTDNAILSYTHIADNLTPDTITISVSDGEFTSNIVLTLNVIIIAIPTESTHSITIDTTTDSFGGNFAELQSFSDIISADHTNLDWSTSNEPNFFILSSDGQFAFVDLSCSDTGTNDFIVTAVADNFTYTFNVSLVISLADECSNPPIIDTQGISEVLLFSDLSTYTADNPYEIDISGVFIDPKWDISELTIVASAGEGSIVPSDTNLILYYTPPDTDTAFVDLFTITVTNPAGGASTFVIDITIIDSAPIADIILPVITIPSDLSTPKDATSINGAEISLAGITASDDVDGIIDVVCAIDGITLGIANIFPVGITTILCTATDRAGNDGTASVTITINPYITEPVDDTYEFVNEFGSPVINDGQFSVPIGVFVNSTNILVADAVNHRIQIFDLDGTFIDKFGSFGTDDGQFNVPSGIYVTGDRIYVSDTSNHRIQIFDLDGTFIDKFGSLGINDGQFSSPRGIYVIDNRIYVVDTSNHRIQIFDLDGTFIDKFGSFGTDDGQFSSPRGIYVIDNRIYVSDTSNHRIQIFDLDGTFIDKFGSLGINNGQFNSPIGIYATADKIYVLDFGNNRIQIFDLDGTFIDKFGSFGTDDGQFNSPRGIYVTGDGIYVADSNNNRIQIIDLDGTFIDEFGSPVINDGQFSSPRGIYVIDNRIYVVDTNNHRIQIFDLDGTFIDKFGSFGNDDGQFRNPRGIYVIDDRIYVSDTINNRIQIFDLDGTFIDKFGSFGNDDGQFNSPRGIYVIDDRIYVVDTTNHRIQIFDLDGTFIDKFGSLGTDDGQFSIPNGIYVTDDIIYVSDTNNHRIQIFDLDGTFIDKFGSFGNDDGQFHSPIELYVTDDRIYVVDTTNHRIQIFDLDGTFIDKFGSLGTDDGQFHSTIGIYVTGDRIYVLDFGNNRVQVFEPVCVGDQSLSNGICVDPVDTTPPVITIPDDLSTPKDATSINGAEVSLAGITASDDVNGIIDVVCAFDGVTLGIANIFPVGTTTISCTATDRAGNDGTASVTITINPYITEPVDDIPVITVPNPFIRIQQGDPVTFPDDITCTFNEQSFPLIHESLPDASSPPGSYFIDIDCDTSITEVETQLLVIIIFAVTPPTVEFPAFVAYSFESSITGGGDTSLGILRGIATDSNNRIIITDAANNRIVIYSSDGMPVASIPNNLSSQVTLSSPQGVAVDGSDQIFVADTENNRIVIFSSDGILVDIITDANGAGGSFGAPQDIAFDSNNRILVIDINADGNDNIVIFGVDGTFVKAIPIADGDAGSFSFPRGITVDGNNRIIVVASGNNSIQIFDSDGTFSFSINGISNDDPFLNPFGVTIDSNDRIIITDTNNNKIHIFDSNGIFVESLTGGSLSNPRGITVDNNNRILVIDSDNNRIQIYDLITSFSPSLLEYIPVYSPSDVSSLDIPSSDAPYEITSPSQSSLITHNNGTALFTPGTAVMPSGAVVVLVSDISEDAIQPTIPDNTTLQSLLEFGDESESITFTKPVKITLNAQSGNIPFWYAPLRDIIDHQIILQCSTSNFDFRDIELFSINECYYEENGNIVIWTNHFTTFGTFSENASIQKKSGGGSNDWMKKPTFGKSFENTNAQLVSDGFIFNGYTLNIIDNWHTDFIKTSSIIGETNHVEMKVYTDKTLSTMTLSLGIPEVGKKSDAETSIYVTLNRNYDNPNGYDIIDITHEQKENLIDEEQTKASITPSFCTPNDNIQRCYTLSLDFVVMAPLKSDVLAISAMDTQRRTTTTFVNEGVEFTGESLLDPHTYNINQKHGSQFPMEILTLTQQDRRYNIWEDNNGYLWERNDYGSYKQITFAEFERNQDKYNSVMTRLHSDFAQLVIDEQNKAVLIFDSTKLISEMGESFAYDYLIPMDKLLDPFVIENMKLEEQKAMDRYHILPQFYEVGNLK